MASRSATSMAGLGRDKLPVRIARLRVAGESPDVDHVERTVETAVDDLAFGIFRRGDDFRDEAQSDLGDLVAQARVFDADSVDRFDRCLHRFLAGFARADGSREALIDVFVEEIVQGLSVAAGEGRED